ncbi:MAG: hypothetical protein WCE21_04160 [Candidatus Babeliales bacterium]
MKEALYDCHDHHDDHTHHSITDEIICHLPYAIFAASLGLILVSILSMLGGMQAPHDHTMEHDECTLDILFHSFHFLHLVFAATGALLTFSRYSRNLIKGFIVALVSSFFFCTLSDIILPYGAARLFGVSMELHLCFLTEWHNVIPFLLVGLINGLIMSQHPSSAKAFHSLVAHFSHILVSCLASLFYMIGQGFYDWHQQMGLVFVLLILVVVVPCTLADIIIPVFFARTRKMHEKHSA